MLSLVVSVLVAATGAFAQSTSPYIPTSDISTQCTSFLENMNSDAGLAQCTGTLLTATKAFSGSNSNPANLTSTLNTLCSADADACDNSFTRSMLSQFFTQCELELNGENPNEAVQELYDIFYFFTPFRAAVCATDASTGAYCAANLSGSSSSKKRDDTLPYVNPAQMRSTWIPYLFMSPQSSADTLCTGCGKAVLQAYVTWEATLPYALGLLQSPILGGQADLWSAVGQKCGDGFLNTITADSGAAPLAALGMAGAAGPLVHAPAAAVLLAVAGLSVALLA